MKMMVLHDGYVLIVLISLIIILANFFFNEFCEMVLFQTELHPLGLHCVQCETELKESFLHMHLRLNHGLMRAGFEKVHRHAEQTPKYDAIRLKVTARNIANLFARFLIKKFDVLCLQLEALKIPRESMPLFQLVSMGRNVYTLQIKSGEILLSLSYLF